MPEAADIDADADADVIGGEGEEEEEDLVVVKRSSKQRKSTVERDEDDDEMEEEKVKGEGEKGLSEEAGMTAPITVPVTVTVPATVPATPADVLAGEDVNMDVDVEMDLSGRIDAVREKVTPESVKLRAFALALYRASCLIADSSAAARATAKAHQLLPRDQRYQSAEIAVKRAFSECPNLSLLVRHLLQQPLHLLYRHSCLSIGLPVAPMLAKPTKEIGEVLRRLSGLAFTVSFEQKIYCFTCHH